MKKAILASALALMTVMTFAQEKKQRTPEERAQKATEKMAKELNLSEEQKEKVLEINLQKAKEMQQLKEEMKVLKEKRKKLRDEHAEQMKSVLSEEQYQKYLQMREEMKKKHQEKRMKHHGNSEDIQHE